MIVENTEDVFEFKFHSNKNLATVYSLEGALKQSCKIAKDVGDTHTHEENKKALINLAKFRSAWLIEMKKEEIKIDAMKPQSYRLYATYAAYKFTNWNKESSNNTLHPTTLHSNVKC